MKCIVLDQNVLRRPELKQLIGSHATTCFVLPDVALLEMAKSEHFDITAARSLSLLRHAVDRAFVSRSPGEVISIERRTQQLASRETWLDDELTTKFRYLLNHLDDGDYLSLLTEDIAQAGAAPFIDAIAEKKKVLHLAALLERTDSSFGKDIRSGRLHGRELLARLFLISATIAHQYVDLPPHLVTGCCATWRSVFLSLRGLARWKEMGGLECAPPEAIANDAYDREYALVASYFDSIETRDKGLRAAYKDLKFVLDAIAPEALGFAPYAS